MGSRPSAVLIGIGGFGSQYLRGLLDEYPDQFELTGAVDPFPDRCARIKELEDRGIRVFPTLDAFYENNSASLAIVSSPIQFHHDQVVQALDRGSHVLCEKPVAATIQDALDMKARAQTCGRLLAIGYQWSFSRAITALKKDILDGVFGAPRRFSTIVHWVREHTYYNRNNWAGKAKDPRGNWVLDSPVNNANAHHLHNMLYLAGEHPETSAEVASIRAETYRAYPVETFDTASVCCTTAGGLEIFFHCSHATEETRHPHFILEFGSGRVECTSPEKGIFAVLDGGEKRSYGCPDDQPFRKLQIMRDAVEGRGGVPCGVDAAIPQLLCVNGIHEARPEASVFPDGMVQDDSGQRLFVPELDNVLDDCFTQHCLPGELGLEWAKPSAQVDLRGYTHFPIAPSPGKKG